MILNIYLKIKEKKMEAIISKKVLQEYTQCDDNMAHAMMNVIRTKVQTKTAPMLKKYSVRDKSVEGMVFIITANAIDVLSKAQEMLSKTNPRINKPMWEKIKDVSLSVINKELANE